MTTQAGDLLTVREAAAKMGVTPECVYSLCRAGRLTHYRLGPRGGSIRVRERDLARYLRGCRIESSDPKGDGPGRRLRHITV